MAVPTPHINAQQGEFAPICLMPGDPLRAKFIAENYLTDVKQVNSVRNMLGYTGKYKGKAVSVMGSGMGIPSISIYSHELFTKYGVEKIIRIGTCGSVSKDVKVRDIVIAQGACTDSGVNKTRFQGYDFAAIGDFGLTTNLVQAAKAKGCKPHVGNVFSADMFYDPSGMKKFELLEKYNVYGVEMEAAGLFGVAMENKKKAAAICTVSDEILTGISINSEERQKSLHEMIEIALESLLLE